MTQVYEYKQKLYNQRRASYILNKIRQLRQHAIYEQQEQNMNEKDRVAEIYAKNNYSQAQCENINEESAHVHPDQSVVINSMVLKYIESYIGKYLHQFDLKQQLISALKKQQSIDYGSIYQNLLQNITSISNNCNNSNMYIICETLHNLSASIINESDALTIQQQQSKQLEWSVKQVYFQYCTFVCFLLGVLGRYQQQLSQNDEMIDNMEKQVVQALFKCLQLNQAILNEIILYLLAQIYTMKPSLLSSKNTNKYQVTDLLSDLLGQIAEVPELGNKQNVKVDSKIQQYELYKYIPKLQEQVISKQELAIIILQYIDINTLESSLNTGLFPKILQSNITIISTCMQRVATIPNNQLKGIIEQAWRQQRTHNDSSQIFI